MKAKLFKEFIGESYAETKSGNTRYWFTEMSDMSEVLGNGIWQLRLNTQDENLPLQVMENFAYLLETGLHPVIQSRGMERFLLWFRADRELGQEEVADAERTIEINYRGQGLGIDLFESNPGGVLQILTTVDRRLTGDQLVQMVGWLESKQDTSNRFKRDKMDPDYIAMMVRKIKEHPNWPEDMTDWALGDW